MATWILYIVVHSIHIARQWETPVTEIGIERNRTPHFATYARIAGLGSSTSPQMSVEHGFEITYDWLDCKFGDVNDRVVYLTNLHEVIPKDHEKRRNVQETGRKYGQGQYLAWLLVRCLAIKTIGTRSCGI